MVTNAPSTSDRPLRVLFVVDAYPTRRDPCDCVFVQDQALALSKHAVLGVAMGRTWSPRQWLRQGCRAQTETMIDGPGPAVYQTRGFVPTTRWPALLVRGRCRAIERAARTYARRFGGPDVLHAHCAAFAGETALHVARARGVPLVITEHYSFAPQLVAEYGVRLLRVYEEADAVVAVSRSLADALRAAGVRRRIDVVPNAVNDAEFSYFPIKPPQDGTWKLLSVARDHDVKDVPTLIEALGLLAADCRFEADIVGPGAHRRARALSVRAGLGGQVRFLGGLSRPELADRMRQSHVVVSSSRLETFGMSLAEALCLGRPVVATDSGGPRDIIRPADGRIVPVGDPAALANAIADVLGRYTEFDQVELSESAHRRFGGGVFARRLLRIYKGVLAASSGEPVTTEAFAEHPA